MTRFRNIVFVLAFLTFSAGAHELAGHSGATYEVGAADSEIGSGKHLKLTIVDGDTGRPAAARFLLSLEGVPYTPAALNKHGIRFTSIHVGKKQRYVVLYARGTGAVEIPLSASARRGTVQITKGLEYVPLTVAFTVRGRATEVRGELRRWSDIQGQGWLPADEHLHYERLDPIHDRDWLAMLDADDLAHGHFMVLKGGNVPGMWAQQYAYGEAGEAQDGARSIRSGEEYRDGSQGHVNLLGIDEVIQPVHTGGPGDGMAAWNYPPLYEVLLEARKRGALSGPAHGARLGRQPTAIVDTVLGAVDFFEIANTHLYAPDLWYLLMNCGYVVPPAAGTDLPNFPFRDAWQPFLGETRMYVKLGDKRDFAAWKEAVKTGASFITSGPMILISVAGAGPGGTVRLPEGGGTVEIRAELSSPRRPQAFEIVHNGVALKGDIEKSTEGGVHRWRIRHRLALTRSGWLAARGLGAHKEALERETGIQQDAAAHTAAVCVIVGGQPIHSPADAAALVGRLEAQQTYYREKGKFETEEDRTHMLALFDRAAAQLMAH